MPACALLVSSDSTTLGMFRQVLAEMEITADECCDPASALHTIATHPYEVIVIDGPEQDGSDELLGKVRRSGINSNSLLISVLDAATSVRNVFATGANFVLYRPLSADRTRASLRAASHLIRREKRRHPRLAVLAQATISYPEVESASATLLDLSEEGLAIQCEQRLPAKSKIYFRFTLPGQMKWIQLSGDTVWQDSTGRAGIRFLGVPQSARRHLKEWLEARILVAESQVTVQFPAAHAGRLPHSPADRRIQSRHACRLGAEVYRSGLDVPHRCNLTDISVGGCYVEMPSPFSPGTAVEIVVRTHTIKFRSRGTVQVVHPGFGMGVAFAVQSSEQREQIRELIKLVFRDRQADSDPVLSL